MGLNGTKWKPLGWISLRDSTKRNFNKLCRLSACMHCKEPSRMARFILVVLLCLIIVVGGVGLWRAFGNKGNQVIPAPCDRYLTLGPDGHYIVKRAILTLENAGQINACLERLGIKNVRVAANYSMIGILANQT